MFFFLLFFSQVHAAELDIGALNRVFNQVAAEVIAAEQVQDAQGRDLIGPLIVEIDEKNTDLDKGNIRIEATVSARNVLWAQNTSSRLSARLITQIQEGAPGAEELHLEASATLETDVLALLRHAIREANKIEDPCSEKTLASELRKDEQAFMRDACVDYRKLDSAPSIGDFFDSLAAIVEKRKTHVLNQLQSISSQKVTGEVTPLVNLQNEMVYIETLCAAFAARKDRAVFRLSTEEGIDIFGGTKASKAQLVIDAHRIEVELHLVSPEGAALYQSTVQDVQRAASLLIEDASDPARAEITAHLKAHLRDLVRTAKSILIPQSAP